MEEWDVLGEREGEGGVGRFGWKCGIRKCLAFKCFASLPHHIVVLGGSV